MVSKPFPLLFCQILLKARIPEILFMKLLIEILVFILDLIQCSIKLCQKFRAGLADRKVEIR